MAANPVALHVSCFLGECSALLLLYDVDGSIKCRWLKEKSQATPFSKRRHFAVNGPAAFLYHLPPWLLALFLLLRTLLWNGCHNVAFEDLSHRCRYGINYNKFDIHTVPTCWGHFQFYLSEELCRLGRKDLCSFTKQQMNLILWHFLYRTGSSESIFRLRFSSGHATQMSRSRS